MIFDVLTSLEEGLFVTFFNKKPTTSPNFGKFYCQHVQQRQKDFGPNILWESPMFCDYLFFHPKITPFPSPIYPPANSQICQWKSTSLQLLTKNGGCFHVTMWLNRKILHLQNEGRRCFSQNHQRINAARCPSLPCHLDLHVLVTSGTAAVTRWPWTGAVGGFSHKKRNLYAIWPKGCSPTSFHFTILHLLVCWLC